ncbi:MAG: GNAT family N-acetyltransferase [Alphaproteobacteria bacterium]|nr:GNAT family N-acetyltransferase [Alphaproteobacteria bacterium]
MAHIRPYEARDLEALYDICLKTGDAGQDASAMYRDPKIIGHIYAGPYGALEPENCFVLEDEVGVGGYIIGTRDTHAFEQRLEREWWPKLRRDHAEPGAPRSDFTPDERMAYLIHHPSRTPRRVSEPYPAHLHIDLLPRFQGAGWGKRMVDTFLSHMRDAGVSTVHLGVGPKNERGVRFYRAYGFHVIDQAPAPWSTYWFGISTNP